eukprot:CAMPEP_0176491144 /NCGR_PEP_ID=MMETSP0200_2-20121128/8270_1 /TAXON_ID=947934 /ORGANISM="Chaetoceros sp., Strain GSL56" /LENGTH=718 /DNA_ID=CAMNT_0017888543 /DNA_START=80 /DNA_END=2236 /DNA_ORIENTATION=-
MSDLNKKINHDYSKGCTLVVEQLLPSSSSSWEESRHGTNVITTKQGEATPSAQQTIDTAVDIHRGLEEDEIDNSNGDGDGDGDGNDSSFLVYTSALHLHCDTGLITCNSEEEDEEISCPTLLLGIAIPHEIAHLFLGNDDNNNQQDESYRNLKKQVRERMLSMIHPSLTQLEPMMWLRNVDIHHDNIEKAKKFSREERNGPPLFFVGGVKDVLILKISSNNAHIHPPTTNDSFLVDGGKNKNDTAMAEWAALQSIVEEVNGEAMTAAPYRVIQMYTIQKMQWMRAEYSYKNDTDRKVDDNNDGCCCYTLDKSINTSIQPIMDMPMCAVCRFRITPERLGLVGLKTHQRCSYQNHASCPNMKFLGLWKPCFCKACRVLQERLEYSGARPFIPTASSPSWMYGGGGGGGSWSWDSANNMGEDGGRIQCYKCGMEETLWVCLTCGIVGCGRYSYGHAERHYIDYRHPFSLELATQRIWDYETSSFVHRDDLLNCPFMQQILGAMNRAAYQGAAMYSTAAIAGSGGGGAATNDECHLQGQNVEVAKKTIMVGEQYEAMLQSALEDQAQHYQGEISRLEAELAAETVNIANLSPSELKQIEELERNIAEMRAGVEKMSRYLVDAQTEEASHRTKANVLLREQSVVTKLLEKLQHDFELEQKQGEQQIEELKQQISDISANIQLQEQIAKNGNLKEAHILGTTNVSSTNKEKGGKRRSFRKNKR